MSSGKSGSLKRYIHMIIGLFMKAQEQAFRTLAGRVREERKSQNLSQTELAHLAGVSLNFLSQLVSGKITVRMDKVLLVLKTLGLELHLRYGKAGVSE